MTDLPYVVNPEAVGDPNQTPIVRLWDAHKYLASDQRVSSQTEDATFRAALEEARRELAELHEEMTTRWVERDRLVQRMTAAEAALAAVRALAKGWIKDGPDGAPRILAERVLVTAGPPDSTDPVEAAPARAGRFEALLAAEHEQFDKRGELLRSVVEYMNAPSGTVSAQRPEERSDEGPKKPGACPECGLSPIADGYSVCEVCAYRPGRSGEEKPAVDLMAALRESVDRARASRGHRRPADGEERK